MAVNMEKEMGILYVLAEVYKKTISNALERAYDSLSESDKDKMISLNGCITMTNTTVDSIIELVSQLAPLMELMSKM